MKKIYTIRQIVIALMALLFLTWAFYKNGWWARIFITPFIICSVAIIMERIFFLLNKEKLSNVFQYIFRISFFAYIFVFLSYMVYYALENQSYSVLVGVAIFLPFVMYFFKKSFFTKKKKPKAD